MRSRLQAHTSSHRPMQSPREQALAGICDELKSVSKLELELSSIYTSLSDFLADNDLNVTCQQAMLLARLGGGRCNISQFHRRAFYIGQNVTHNIKVLVERGYLTATKSNEDKREVFCVATEKGLSLGMLVRGFFMEEQANGKV